jgi:hypothetical protein
MDFIYSSIVWYLLTLFWKWFYKNFTYWETFKEFTGLVNSFLKLLWEFKQILHKYLFSEWQKLDIGSYLCKEQKNV